MLTKAEVSMYTTKKVLSESNRLHRLKYKDFPKKDPPDEVLADYELLWEELWLHIQIIKQLVNLITPEFVETQRKALDT